MEMRSLPIFANARGQFTISQPVLLTDARRNDGSDPISRAFQLIYAMVSVAPASRRLLFFIPKLQNRRQDAGATDHAPQRSSANATPSAISSNVLVPSNCVTTEMMAGRKASNTKFAEDAKDADLDVPARHGEGNAARKSELPD